MDSFYVIDKYTSAEIKIKSSVFISHLQPVGTIEKAKEFISEISSQYKDATHNCWAYIIGKNAEIFHSSDSGEPAGTAGKPILNSLQKNNLTNIAAVVTRYYGGTKLGVRGLIDAYSESTILAVQEAMLKKLVVILKYKVITNYDFFETLKYKLKNLGAEIVDLNYGESIKFMVQIEDSLNEQVFSYLTELEKMGKLTIQGEAGNKPPGMIH
jgi:uncharacterized YigZ family protein